MSAEIKKRTIKKYTTTGADVATVLLQKGVTTYKCRVETKSEVIYYDIIFNLL